MKTLKYFILASLAIGVNNYLNAQNIDSIRNSNPEIIPDTMRIAPTKYIPDTGEMKLPGGALIDTVTTKNRATKLRPEHEGKPDSIPKLQ